MFRHRRYVEPSLSGMTLRPSPERIVMKYASVGLTAFLVALLAFSIFTPVELTNAEEVLFANQVTGSAVSLTTSGDINLSLQSGATGAVRTALNTVSVTAGSNGYQLYVSATGNTNALIRDGAVSTGTDATTGAPTYSASDIIPTLTSSNNLVPISSPTNLENNTWGFAVPAKNTTSGSGSEDVVTNGFDASYPTGDNSSASSKFASIPIKGNDILIAKRSSTATSVPTNFYYGVKATSSKPSGLYTNTITYTAIGDSNVNGLASVTPERTNQLAGGVTLDVATPSTLALSSISSVSVTVGGQTCSNAIAYKNGSLVNITCSSPALATGWHEVIANITTTGSTTETYVVNPGIEYYGDAETIASTMQDFTLAECNAMNTGQSAILSDTRDGKTYSIAKQADGNCWMTQNLRLGTPGQSITLTSADSDVSFDYTINSSDIQTTTGADWSSSVDATHVYSFAENSNVSDDNKIAYGNLYNWYTATASTGTSSITSGDAYSSICPKGWKLPPDTGNGSYANLMAATIDNIPSSAGTGSIGQFYTNKFVQAPLSIALAGRYGGDVIVAMGSGARYWSRTAASISRISYFGFNIGGDFNFHHRDYRTNGFAVRCVMVTAEPTYMQELTSAYCDNMTTAQTMTLTDVRDLNTYQVTKQADGNCWMTQNLRIGTTSDGTSTQNVTLTSANSDITGANKTLVDATSAIQTSNNSTSWSTPADAYHIFARTSTNATTYGNLYNWYTATASSGTASTTSYATMSICPSGWKLPPNTSTGSYTSLMQAQISSDMPTYSATGTAGQVYTSQFTQAPLSFALSGNYGGSLYGQDTYGDYWSRTARTSNDAYFFYFYTNGQFNLQNATYKYIGRAVRCVFIP